MRLWWSGVGSWRGAVRGSGARPGCARGYEAGWLGPGWPGAAPVLRGVRQPLAARALVAGRYGRRGRRRPGWWVSGVWWGLELLLPGCGWVPCRVVLFVLLACLHDPGRLLGVRCCGIWFWWVGVGRSVLCAASRDRWCRRCLRGLSPQAVVLAEGLLGGLWEASGGVPYRVGPGHDHCIRRGSGRLSLRRRHAAGLGPGRPSGGY